METLPRHEKIMTPAGYVEVDIEPEATVKMLIDHLIDEAKLVRGDIFEIFVGDHHMKPEQSLSELPKGDVILVATGGAV